MRAPLLAVLGYILFTVLTVAPLLAHISTTVPSDPGDPVLNAWILWWNATARPLTTTWWDGLGFYPIAASVTWSEHLLGLAWLTSPLIWMGATPATAHNVAFIVSFPLSAIAAYALAWQVTRRHDAAFLAGLCFGFHPFRAAHLSHVQVLTSFWMPLALLGLHRFFASGRRAWLALFAVSWLLQALSNNYYLLYFSVLVGAWLLWFGLRRDAIRRFAEAVAAWAIAGACLAPIAYAYLTQHAAQGLKRSFEEIAGFSGDLSSLLNPSFRLAVWGWMRFDARVERELFIGFTAAIVIAVGVLWRLRARLATSAESRDRIRRRSVAIAGGIGLALMLAAAWAWLDAAGYSPAPSIPIRTPEKPFTLGLVLAAIALAFWRPVRDAIRERSVFAFYTLATILTLLCTLGPEGRLLGTKVLYRTPYGYLMGWIPGFDGVRVPARFLMVATLCLAVALALAFVRLAPLGDRRRLVLAIIVAVALVSDGAVRTLPLASVPVPAPSLAGVGPGAVLELPTLGVYEDAAALYRSSAHGRRVVNGYSGYESPYYYTVKEGLEREDVGVLDELAADAPLIVLVERSRDGEGRWQRFVERARDVERLGESGGFARYRLRQRARPPEAPRCCALAVHTVTADTSGEQAGLMLDRDPRTPWRTDVEQKPGHTVVADLGASHTIAWIELDQGLWPHDRPRGLQIAVSDNGQEWTDAWAGDTAAAMMQAVVRDPLHIVVRLTLPGPSRGRYVRLRQTAAGEFPVWRIAELRIGGTNR